MRISDWSSDVCSSDLAAILALVGVVNIPIIKFSVDWWSTLHQPASVLRLDGPTIHPSMLWPLLIVALGFKLYYVTVLLLRIKSELVAARLRALDLVTVQGSWAMRPPGRCGFAIRSHKRPPIRTDASGPRPPICPHPT